MSSSTPGSGGPPEAALYQEVQASEDFSRLRRTHRSFAFPMTIGFICWYLLFVLLSNYAGDFMGTKVLGNINVAFVFGIAQFITTFAIAWYYSRYAEARIDPLATQLKGEVEQKLLTHRATAPEDPEGPR